MYAFEVKNSPQIKHYTYLKDIFLPFPYLLNQYNWLLSDCECNFDFPPVFYKKDIILSGKELYPLVYGQATPQFIYGVLSNIDLNENYVIGTDKIIAENYPFFDKPNIQRNKSSIEVIFDDSTSFIFLTSEIRLRDDFIKSYPEARLIYS